MTVKDVIKGITPPFVFRLYRKIFRRSENQKSVNRYGWFGDYPDWESASKDCSGYDSGVILEKVKLATLKVRDGDAVYERDSVLFNKVEYSWPLLAGLLWVSARNNGRLSVLDFGGSLGSSYFQNRKFIDSLFPVEWNIVEQPHFVECGKKNFLSEHLKFFPSINECIQEQNPNILLLSSVLPYLKDPYAFLKEVFSYRIPFVIIDLTGIFKNLPTRITVQKVPPEIYEASYPCWIFNESEFVRNISSEYSIVESFQSYLNACYYIDNDKTQRAGYKGFILEIKEKI